MSATVITVIERAKVEAINREYGLATRSAEEAVGHAVECGRMLAAVKADVAHGEWGPWLAGHFEGTGETAALYMRMAADPARVPSFLSVRDAKQQLAKPRAASPRDAVGMLAGIEDDDEPGGTSTALTSARIDQARDRLRAEAEPLWTPPHQRRQRKIEELLVEAGHLLTEATQPGLTSHAIAETLRRAEVKAKQATGQLSELAFSFER